MVIRVLIADDEAMVRRWSVLDSPTRRSVSACSWWRGRSRAYVSAILGRLDVRNRVQAAVLAHEAGIVERD